MVCRFERLPYKQSMQARAASIFRGVENHLHPNQSEPLGQPWHLVMLQQGFVGGLYCSSLELRVRSVVLMIVR